MSTWQVEFRCDSKSNGAKKGVAKFQELFQLPLGLTVELLVGVVPTSASRLKTKQVISTSLLDSASFLLLQTCS